MRRRDTSYCSPSLVLLVAFSFIFMIANATRAMATSAAKQCSFPPPNVAQPYKLLTKTKLSHDSFLLRFQIPAHRTILGIDPTLPTCLKIDYPNGTDKNGNPKVLSKSYSPISHPATQGTFDLVVKEYPVQPGGGVGAFLCHLPVGQSVTGTLKKERQMHGSPVVEGRWKCVGLVAGGTGIAPLLQIAHILLQSPKDTDTKIYILSINRHPDDILMREELDRLAQEHSDRLFVTYSITDSSNGINHKETETAKNGSFHYDRGSVELAKAALPPSTRDGKTMILVCGKDGFVSTWAGPVARGPPKPDGSKGPKIQGPLLGILAKAGYDASEVFKY